MNVDKTSVVRGLDGRPLQDAPLLPGLLLSVFGAVWFFTIALISLGPLILLTVTGNRDVLPTVAAGIWLTVIYSSSRFAGAFAIMTWRRRLILERFAITVLRPFGSDDASLLYRERVAPALGCYGRVFVLDDATLARQRTAADRLNDVRILGDADFAMASQDEDWRALVFSHIATSDLAVIDITMPSLNVLWEAARCIELLPPNRVLFIRLRGGSSVSETELIRDYVRDCCDPLVAESFARLAPPLNYGGFFFGSWRFRLGLFLALCRIRNETCRRRRLGA